MFNPTGSVPGALPRNPMTESITLTINGATRTGDVEPRLLLIHYLREVAGLTGSHVGCETSLCGACTVEVNGKLHKMQEAFWNEHGLQCGFCTPGMIMASKQILDRNPNPTEAEIRHGLEGNMCRCTGYQHIVKAVQAAAKAGA